MLERFTSLRRAATEDRKPSAFSRLVTHVRSLPPSDRVIVAILAAALALSSLLGLYALERSVLVEAPSRGGSLIEGIVGTPRFVNPLLALSDADRDLVALTYAGLMGYGKDGELVPVLAESYTVSEDGTVYTFLLRADAKFSDGRPVTAEDVVFTVEKAQDIGLKSPELPNWANILVEGVDARTVRFTLPKPYAPFLTDATLGILPSHIWRDIQNEEFPFSPYMTEPVGAGPYKVERIQKDKNGAIERYELVSFKGYALGEPYLTRLTLRFFKDTEAVRTAYARGRIESASGVPSENALRVPYSRTFGVFFNQNRNPVFAQAQVREALSLAIDRSKLVSTALGGFATPLAGPLPLAGTMLAASASEASSPDAVREILRDGGWEYSEETGLWTRDAAELRVTVRTSNVPELRAVAESIREDWSALGVPTTIEYFEPGSLAQNVIRPREYDALLFGMVLGRDADLFPFWNSSERNDPGLNIAMYANSSVDDLLADVRTEQDQVAREAMLLEAAELIAKDYPAAFTHAPDFVYAIPDRLYGVALAHVAEPSDRFSNVRYWYRSTEWVWPFFVDSK